MLQRDAALAQWAASQQGAIVRRQARSLGFTDREFDARVDSGILIPVFRGAFRHAAAAAGWKTRLSAAVLSCGETAAASHRSGGRLHDLRGIPRYRPEVTVVDTTARLQSGLHVHRTNLLDDLDVTIVDGIRTTTIPRTLLDLGSVLPFEVVELAAQDAIIRRLTSALDLVAQLERTARRGRRGVAILRAIVFQSVPPDGVQSWLEKLLHDIVAALPVEPPVLQYPFTCDDGREVVLDQAWPHERASVEGDGQRWHATSKEFAATMARRRSIMASGWDHYQYGWTDARHRRPAVEAELLRVLPPLR